MSEPASLQKPTLLFVHGAAGDGRLWQPVIDALPHGWRAETVTLTYFGTDPWPDDGSGFSTALHADDVVKAAERIGGNIRLVCWSYSVHVGLEALMRAPGLFHSAFLYEAAIGQYIADPAALEAYNSDVAAFFAPVLAALETQGEEAAVRAMLGERLDEVPDAIRQVNLANAAMMRPMMLSSNPATRIGHDELGAIAIPVTVGVGSETRPVFDLPSRALAQALGKGHLEEVAGADHMLPECDPVRFAGLVIS